MIKKIILASSSPRRKELLDNLGLNFKIVTPNCDEDCDDMLDPNEYAIETSKQKGSNVYNRLKDEKVDLKDTLIVACDTIVYFDYGDGVILGKPKDEREAYLMISLLSDSWHSVFSGLTLIDGNTGNIYTDYSETRVKFKMLNEAEIEGYLKTGEYLGKAGSYAIQGIGGTFVDGIEGDWSNVVGFPISKFTDMLKDYFSTTIFELRDNVKND